MNLSLLTLIGLGCAPDPPGGVLPPLPNSLLASDSDSETADPLDLTTALAPDQPTVVHVTWSGEVPAKVRYDTGRSLLEAPGVLNDEGRYEAWLVGTPANAPVDLWLVDESGLALSDVHRVYTDALSWDPGPMTTAWTSSGADDSGLLMLAHSVSRDAAGVTLHNPVGETVWAWQAPSGSAVEAARWADDGVWALVLPETGDGDDNVLVRIAASGELLGEWPAPQSHHDLRVLPDGTVAWLQMDSRQIDGLGEVLGDALVELGPDGEQRVVFSTFDAFDPWDRLTTPDDGDTSRALDWTHANGLDHSEEHDAYLLSLRGLDAVLRVDRATGEVPWSFSGEQVTPTEASWTVQHSPAWDGDEVLVFANEGRHRTGSWVTRVAPEDGAAQETWSAETGAAWHTAGMGHVVLGAQGTVFIDYGVEGVVREVDADGVLVSEHGFEDRRALRAMSQLTAWTLGSHSD